MSNAFQAFTRQHPVKLQFEYTRNINSIDPVGCSLAVLFKAT